jgi:hypothetical protein
MSSSVTSPKRYVATVTLKDAPALYDFVTKYNEVNPSLVANGARAVHQCLLAHIEKVEGEKFKYVAGECKILPRKERDAVVIQFGGHHPPYDLFLKYWGNDNKLREATEVVRDRIATLAGMVVSLGW